MSPDSFVFLALAVALKAASRGNRLSRLQKTIIYTKNGLVDT